MKDKKAGDIIRNFIKTNGYDENGKRSTMKYKKYIVFEFDGYEPNGGMGDITGSFNDLQEAKNSRSKTMNFDHIQIVDRDTWQLVWYEDAKET